MEKRDSKGLTEKEFLANYNPDKYPKPSLTADIIVFRRNEDNEEVDILLIKRKGHPFLGCWALPGGFAERGETIEHTAARELEEETGVTGLEMALLGIYSKPGRDPRGWTVSAAYMAIVNSNDVRPKAGDDAREVAWGRVSMAGDCPDVIINGENVNDELAFDHYKIIADAAKCILRRTK